jgi:type IV pilus assembly protein PilN
VYQINLLPWREQARKNEQTRFAVIAACVAGLGLFCTVFFHLHYSGIIKKQMQRNDILQASLDAEAATLMTLNKKRDELISIDSQLHFVYELRESSYIAVRLLNELTIVNPDAVTLYKVVRRGKSITVFGKARSNLQITLFLENIEKSKFFSKPELTEIQGKAGTEGEERNFQLQLVQEE